ncbi:MAG TPA: hypothetical protein VEX43_05695 [Chthoniobacterales bacterium]|nr:hypothetical protein [Chthoniobacterales bacterium]
MSAKRFGRLFQFSIRVIRVIRGLDWFFFPADYAESTEKRWTASEEKTSGIPTYSVLHEMTQKLSAFTFLALAAVLIAGCASTTETTTTTRTREQSSMYAR